MTISGKWFGLAGTPVTIGAWLLVWPLMSESAYLWGTLSLVGIALCLIGALKGSKWFWVPTSLGLIVTIGTLAGAAFGY